MNMVPYTLKSRVMSSIQELHLCTQTAPGQAEENKDGDKKNSHQTPIEGYLCEE